MPKYLCLQRSILSQTGMDNAQMQDMYAKFEAWSQKYKDSITDMGGMLGAGKIEAAEGTSSASLAKVHELTGGYMIVTAENLDEAARIARECPGLVVPGSACEVIEIHTQ